MLSSGTIISQGKCAGDLRLRCAEVFLTAKSSHPLRKLTYELLFGNIFTVGPNCPIALALAVWIRTQSSIDVESSAKVKTYTKRFGYAEVLCTSLFEFPDGNISTVGTKRFRYAEVLCTSMFCCCSRS